MRRVPRIFILTDRRISQFPLVEQVERALYGAARADTVEVGLVFREKDLDPVGRLRLGSELCRAARQTGSSFVVATSGERDGGESVAAELGAEGIHLSSHAPCPRDFSGLLGRSCHAGPEVLRARLEGMDYLTVSPLFLSISKEGLAGRGPDLVREALSVLGTASRVSVIALGGVGPGRVGEAMSAGAHGVAVCGAVMRAEDPEAVAFRIAREVKAAAESELPKSGASKA